MPFKSKAILKANEVLAGLDQFDHDVLLDTMKDAKTVLDAARTLGLLAVLPADQVVGLEALLKSLPASLDAAGLAALRSALARGVRTQLTWQPGYDFELRMWEVTEGSDGLLNIHLVSPHPDEPTST